MFDIGWSELVIIGVVALIVIGPRDLPEMFRTLGRFTAKLRSMARDFQRAMESAADDAGVKDVAKDLKSMASGRNMGLDAVKDAASKFEKWDPLKPGAPKPASPMRPASGTVGTTPAADAATAPVVALGPNTQALADKVAASKVTAAETAAALRAARAPAADATPAAEPASPAANPGTDP